MLKISFVKDIVKFVTIFVIIFIAFMFAINNLYWYYQKSVREQSQVFIRNKSVGIKAEESFGTYLLLRIEFKKKLN